MAKYLHLLCRVYVSFALNRFTTCFFSAFNLTGSTLSRNYSIILSSGKHCIVNARPLRAKLKAEIVSLSLRND